jgi:glycosyltransferase involved in cell wall biosynthesis
VKSAADHPLVTLHLDVSNAELKALHDSVLVVLAPLRYGTGVKGKINYGLNNGVPVIGTRIACEGMHLVHRKSVYIANLPAQIRQGISRLSTHADLWKRLQRGGVEVMKRFFGVETASEVLLRSLREIGAPANPTVSFPCPYERKDWALLHSDETLSACPMGIPHPTITYNSESSLVTEVLPRKEDNTLELYEGSVREWMFDEEARALPPSTSCLDNAFVTFVMPTLCARPTLLRAIDSVRAIRDCNWRLILVYSDIKDPSDQLEGLQDTAPLSLAFLSAAHKADSRIQYLWSRTGRVTSNYGGSMRNIAFQFVTTPWIAFLDDDDMLTPDYIQRLREESSSYPNASLVLFRMSCGKCYHTIIPPPDMFEILVNHAGISFAVKSGVVAPRGRIQFTDGAAEDHHFIHDVQSCEQSLVISGSITYLVDGFVDTNGDRYIPSVELLRKETSSCGEHNYNPVLASSAYLGLKFPENRNLFFQSNIIGLKQAIYRSRLSGCVADQVFRKKSVEVHFGFETKMANPDGVLIQIQMEQIQETSVRNDLAPGTDHAVFSRNYINKLRRATQVQPPACCSVVMP